MKDGAKRSTGSTVRDRWAWWLAAAVIAVTVVAYLAIDRAELYAINVQWWEAVGRHILGR